MINQQRLCEEFARQAAIASPSRREGEISRYLTWRFQELGGTVTMDQAGAAAGSESGNLIVQIPARGKESEPLMLSVHMDTVEPAEGVTPVLADGVFTSAGETILGADDKAGIAEIIEALEVIRERDIPHGPLEVVVTICEEIGLVGAKLLDYSLIRSRRGLALDTSGVDRIIRKAPCANKLRFEILGRESHAGIAPEQGLSAIAIAGKAIAEMKLGRIDDETTANLGTIEGGQATNIVPNRVVIEGEARSHDGDKLARQTEHMVGCFQRAALHASVAIDGKVVHGAVRVEVVGDYPLMQVGEDAGIVQLVREAGAALGRTIAVEAAGGGSDANIFNGHGIETVILGTGMDRVHTVDEQVKVTDMVRVAELLVEIIRRA
ncbi:M20/M25/M40 family metallo-hydrolase [Trichloromonas sp.]|uniref:M20/M25/M40 family metallo-hydrolase n=1 Tax=Trichloromonas sp. TaxID=3069249 RepID=UPI002A477C00|nr:M20/M25/M40 family metallo-hydrolase [Trichloromonas sp.]